MTNPSDISTTDKRFNKSLDGGGAFTQLDLTGHGLVVIQNISSTGTQNNLSVTGARHLILRCNNASDLTITGFAPTVAAQYGDIIEVKSIHITGNVFLAHANTGSTASNRLINIVTSCNTPLAAHGANASNGGWARYRYDGSDRWILDAHEQGSWIISTVNSHIAYGGGTIVVGVNINRYMIKDKTLYWNLYLGVTPTGTVTNFDFILPVSGMSSGANQTNVGYCSSSSSGIYCRVDSPGGGGGAYITLTQIIGGGANANLGSGSNGYKGTFIIELA